MYESRRQAVISSAAFYRRMLMHLLLALVFLLISLAGGMLGYHLTEGLGWLDAFLNAAMLLGGMGPIGTIQTDSGKLFAGCYALYAGLLFVACTALIITPVLHRVLHVLHVDESSR